MDHRAHEGIELVARLVSGPVTNRTDRLELLASLLNAPAGGWTPARVRALSPLDGAGTEKAVLSLKRAGALEWRSERGVYVIPAECRPVITALYLITQPTPPEALVGAQAALFGVADGRIGPDGDDVALTGLVELLEEDVLRIEAAPSLSVRDQVELADHLEQHVADAQRVVDQLAEHPSRQLVERAVALIARLGAGVAGLVEALSDEGRDRLPKRGGLSPAQLRDGVRELNLERLAVAIGHAPRAPRAQRLPHEDALVDALAAVLAVNRTPELPDAAPVRHTAPVAARKDSLALLLGALGAQQMPSLEERIRGCETWQDAVVSHHGFVRLHERLVSAGLSGLVSDGELVYDPSPAVGAVSRALAEHWEELGDG